MERLATQTGYCPYAVVFGYSYWRTDAVPKATKTSQIGGTTAPIFSLAQHPRVRLTDEAPYSRACDAERAPSADPGAPRFCASLLRGSISCGKGKRHEAMRMRFFFSLRCEILRKWLSDPVGAFGRLLGCKGAFLVIALSAWGTSAGYAARWTRSLPLRLIPASYRGLTQNAHAGNACGLLEGKANDENVPLCDFALHARIRLLALSCIATTPSSVGAGGNRPRHSRGARRRKLQAGTVDRTPVREGTNRLGKAKSSAGPRPRRHTTSYPQARRRIRLAPANATKAACALSGWKREKAKHRGRAVKDIGGIAALRMRARRKALARGDEDTMTACRSSVSD
ncbi:hypothetical protein PSPO01_08442 [Paraphaeosphaeria sporulosa]